MYHGRASYTGYHIEQIDNIPGNGRRFDLCVGDKVKLNRNYDGKEGRYFTVTGIYDRLFTCIDRFKVKTSFTKREYVMGDVILVQRGRQYGETVSGGKQNE